MGIMPTPPSPIDPNAVTQSTLGFLPQGYNASRHGQTYNSQGPYTSTSWEYGPDGQMTQRQSYDPFIDQTYRNALQHQQNVRGVSNDALAGAGAEIGRGFNPNNLPALTGSVNAGRYRTGTDRSGFIDMPGANDFSGERQRSEDAIYGRYASRLDDKFSRAHHDSETKLRNQGFVPGTDAYSEASRDLGNQENDAYAGAARDAVLGGGQEQSRMLADALRIRGQQEGESNTSFNQFNQGEQQNFLQRYQSAGLGNNARAQEFGQQLTQHETPINDFTQMERFGSAVPNLPQLQQGIGAFSPNGSLGDMAQLYNLQRQGQMDQFNQRQNLFNTGAGLVGGALTGTGVGGSLVNGARNLFGGGGGGAGGIDAGGNWSGGGQFGTGGFDNFNPGDYSDYDPSMIDPNLDGFDWANFDPGQFDDYSWLMGG